MIPTRAVELAPKRGMMYREESIIYHLFEVDLQIDVL